MAKLTNEDLIHEGACLPERELFESLFGDWVEVTDELCVRHAGRFDFEWAGRKLLHGEFKLIHQSRVRAAWLRKVAALNQNRADYAAGRTSRSYHLLTINRIYRNMEIAVARAFCHYFNQQGGVINDGPR